MRKIFLIPLLLFTLIFTSFLFFCLHPDDLKPLIKKQFEKYSNSTITLDEPLAFSIFPFFGVKTKHIAIVSSDLKVEMANPDMQLKLLPFLHGKISMGRIQIDELVLNQRSPLLTMKLNNVRFKISAVDHSYLTMLYFKFAGFGLAGDARISSNVTVAEQTAAFKNIHAAISGLTLDGELTAKNILDNPDFAGHFTLQSPNLKNTLRQINFLKTQNIPDINHLKGDVDFFANSESFRVKSNFYVDNIQSPDIKIENISAQLNFQNSILDVALSQASAFGGDVNGEINVNFIAESPSMTAHVKGLNLQIDSILKFMQASQINIYPNTKISGMGNIELDVTSNGIEINSLIRNLDGTSQISISNGLFMGKDWDEIVTNLAASNHAITNETISENFRIFRFKQLTASFKINNGIFFNDDLLIDSSTINVKGKGQINFPNNSIDYLLQAELQNTYNGTDNIILATLPLSGSLV